MNRDLAVPLLFLLLLPLAATCTPETFLAAALVLATFVALLVAPWLRHAGPLRVLAVLVAAGPFLAYGLIASPRHPDDLLLPGLGVLVVGLAAIVVAGLPARAGRVAAVAILAVIAGDLLLGRAGLPLLPEGFNPVRDPVLRVTRPVEIAEEPREGLLAGRATLDGDGRLVRATTGRWPAGTRLVAVAGVTTWEEQRIDGATLIAWPYPAGASPVLLDTLSAVVVLGERHDAGWWALASGGIASYARRGGVVVGPAPGRAWPEPLGRGLGAAGRSRTSGPENARAFGLGRVVRAGSEDEIREALAWGLEVPRLRTAFDAGRPPPLPDALEPWRDDPASRRPQLVLLLVYALVAAALDRVLRGRGPRLLGLVAPSLALGLALVWAAHGGAAVRVHAIALDLGGGGGRRLEALALAAGPEGWAGAVGWEGGGYAYALGAREDVEGRLHVAPNRVAWAVRETVSVGAGGPRSRDPRARFLRGFLRGPVGQDEMEVGRGGMLPASIDGGESPVAWVLEHR